MRLSKLIGLALNDVVAISGGDDYMRINLARKWTVLVGNRNVDTDGSSGMRFVGSCGRLTTSHSYEYGWWIAFGELKINMWRDEVLAEAHARPWNAYRRKQEQESATAN